MAILIIKKEDLPPISGSSQSYPIRYRLVSEDRSKFSYWSPIFNIPVQRNYSVVTLPVSNAGTIVSAVWKNQVIGFFYKLLTAIVSTQLFHQNFTMVVF
jgi:hypothetical protein